MRMTIETAIRNLSMYDVNECGNAELYTWYKDIDKDMKDSLNVATETMRKYQQIQEIIKEHDNDRMPEDYWYIDRVREVIEDGNVN